MKTKKASLLQVMLALILTVSLTLAGTTLVFAERSPRAVRASGYTLADFGLDGDLSERVLVVGHGGYFEYWVQHQTNNEYYRVIFSNVSADAAARNFNMIPFPTAQILGTGLSFIPRAVFVMPFYLEYFVSTGGFETEVDGYQPGYSTAVHDEQFWMWENVKNAQIAAAERRGVQPLRNDIPDARRALMRTVVGNEVHMVPTNIRASRPMAPIRDHWGNINPGTATTNGNPSFAVHGAAQPVWPFNTIRGGVGSAANRVRYAFGELDPNLEYRIYLGHRTMWHARGAEKFVNDNNVAGFTIDGRNQIAVTEGHRPNEHGILYVCVEGRGDVTEGSIAFIAIQPILPFTAVRPAPEHAPTVEPTIEVGQTEIRVGGASVGDKVQVSLAHRAPHNVIIAESIIEYRRLVNESGEPILDEYGEYIYVSGICGDGYYNIHLPTGAEDFWGIGVRNFGFDIKFITRDGVSPSRRFFMTDVIHLDVIPVTTEWAVRSFDINIDTAAVTGIRTIIARQGHDVFEIARFAPDPCSYCAEYDGERDYCDYCYAHDRTPRVFNANVDFRVGRNGDVLIEVRSMVAMYSAVIQVNNIDTTIPVFSRIGAHAVVQEDGRIPILLEYDAGAPIARFEVFVGETLIYSAVSAPAIWHVTPGRYTIRLITESNRQVARVVEVSRTPRGFTVISSQGIGGIQVRLEPVGGRTIERIDILYQDGTAVAASVAAGFLAAATRTDNYVATVHFSDGSIEVAPIEMDVGSESTGCGSASVTGALAVMVMLTASLVFFAKKKILP